MIKHPNLSFWESEWLSQHWDLVVVGSGIVGSTAALEAAKLHPEWSILCLEKSFFPLGASTRNAGFACFGSISELHSDLKSMSAEEIKKLVHLRWSGLNRLRENLKNYDIAYQNSGGFELVPENENNNWSTRESIDHWNDLVFQAIGLKDVYKRVDNVQGIQGSKHFIYNQYEGLLNPMLMTKALHQELNRRGVKMISGMTVESIDEDKNELHIEDLKSSIIAKRIIVATNGFARKLFPDLEVVPARNQVLITEPISDLKINGGYHSNEGYIYFRNVGNRILLGGARHIDLDTENTDEFDNTEVIQTFLKRYLYETISVPENIKIERWWSGIMGLGSTKEPVVKNIHDNLVVAVRLGGMGVAIGSLIGFEAVQLLD